MKTVALIDFHTGGHHLSYQKMFAHALVETGHRVLAICPEPDSILAYVAEKCGNRPGALAGYACRKLPDIRILYWRLRYWLRPLIQWRGMSAPVRRAARYTGFKPDVVFFLYLDDHLGEGPRALMKLLPWIFRYRWSGLYFKPHHLRQAGINAGREPSDSIQRSYHASGLRTEKEWLKYGEDQEVFLRARNCVGVGVLDEGMAPLLDSRLQKTALVFPDCSIADDAHSSGTQVDILGRCPADKKIVALLGVLYRRKGLMDLIQAAQALTGNDKIYFLGAGKLDKNIRAGYPAEELALIDRLIEEPPSNLLVVNDIVSDFDSCIREADVLFLAYRDFPFSSNLLFKAAKYRKPVIVSDGYLMADRVRKYRMGIVVEQANINQMVDAIGKLTADPGWCRPNLPPDFEGYLHEHSEERLQEALRTLIAKAP